jgi:hypothetical protein
MERYLSLAGPAVPTAGGAIVASAELCDPETGIFAATGDLTVPRAWYAAALLVNGQVLIVGGFRFSDGPYDNDNTSADLYDPTTGTFAATGNIARLRIMPTATLLPTGWVLVVGGTQDSRSAELYDPAAGTFVYAGDTTVRRKAHAATLLQTGKVLLSGGVAVFGCAELYE